MISASPKCGSSLSREEGAYCCSSTTSSEMATSSFVSTIRLISSLLLLAIFLPSSCFWCFASASSGARSRISLMIFHAVWSSLFRQALRNFWYNPRVTFSIFFLLLSVAVCLLLRIAASWSAACLSDGSSDRIFSRVSTISSS